MEYIVKDNALTSLQNYGRIEMLTAQIDCWISITPYAHFALGMGGFMQGQSFFIYH